MKRYNYTGSIDDLRSAVQSFRDALSSSSDDADIVALAAPSLISAYEDIASKPQWLEVDVDLDASIDAIELEVLDKVIQAYYPRYRTLSEQEQSSGMVEIQRVLGRTLLNRYWMTHVQDDLHTAGFHLTAVSERAELGPIRGKALCDLGRISCIHFEENGDLRDAEISIRHHETAVTLLPDLKEGLIAHHYLCEALIARYKRSSWKCTSQSSCCGAQLSGFCIPTTTSYQLQPRRLPSRY